MILRAAPNTRPELFGEVPNTTCTPHVNAAGNVYFVILQKRDFFQTSVRE